MKRATLVKVTVITVVLAAVAGAVYYFLWLPQRNQDKLVGTTADELFGWKYPVAKFPLTGSDGARLAYSSIRDPGGIPEGLPVRLKVPVIGVDSAIEDALITPDGRMDVPSGTKNVAWFALGPNPGETGSAVIGGHYGFYQGNTGPTVFYKLDQLKVGDKIFIVDDKGDTLTFQVREIKLFDRNADATTVFTSDDGKAHLNLITCEGVWNRVNDSYPKRRVVFTDAIPTEGAAAPAAPAPVVAVAPPTLSIGARGEDVTALQTALQAKGFLTMPPGVAHGYFGPLTRAAVARYQVSVALPSTGVFDATTRAKLSAEQSPPIAARPTLPATAATTPPASSLLSVLTQAIKGLYATPLDGGITSLLLIGIVFLVFKIIRH